MIVPDEFLSWKGDFTITHKERQRIIALYDALETVVKRVNILEAALKQHKHTDECKRLMKHSCLPKCKDNWRKFHGNT